MATARVTAVNTNTYMTQPPGRPTKALHTGRVPRFSQLEWGEESMRSDLSGIDRDALVMPTRMSTTHYERLRCSFPSIRAKISR